MRDKIEKFVKEEINPALDMHGGFLEIEKFDSDTNSLYVKLGGGCQGCSASNETLKIQIEAFLKEEFPDLKEVIDTTDHDAGSNPYYTNE
jgi:Fe/S biogenesis protein NfuA